MYCRQIVGSDVILLNKVDLAVTSDLVTLEDAIRKINPTAPLYRTVRGEVNLGSILGISAYASAPRFQAPETRKGLQQHQNVHHDSEHEHDHDHEHAKAPRHYELRGISSLQVTCPILSPQKLEELDEWIRTVLWEGTIPGSVTGLTVEILRCKGLFTAESGERYVLQGVRNMYEVVKVAEDAERAEDMGISTGKLVFIGKGLTEDVRNSLSRVLDVL